MIWHFAKTDSRLTILQRWADVPLKDTTIWKWRDGGGKRRRARKHCLYFKRLQSLVALQRAIINYFSSWEANANVRNAAIKHYGMRGKWCFRVILLCISIINQADMSWCHNCSPSGPSYSTPGRNLDASYTKPQTNEPKSCPTIWQDCFAVQRTCFRDALHCISKHPSPAGETEPQGMIKWKTVDGIGFHGFWKAASLRKAVLCSQDLKGHVASFSVRSCVRLTNLIFGRVSKQWVAHSIWESPVQEI